MDDLKNQERRFVEEYLFDLNATQAAIRAGYSTVSAQSIACKLMKKTKVKNAIDIAMAERSRRTGVSQDRIITELARIAFINPSDFMDLNKAKVKETFSPDDAAAVSGVKYKSFETESGGGTERNIEMHNKVKALELLGKHLGMFREKVDINTEPIEIKVNGDFDDC
ncbi:terminase small subunit [Anaerotignum propionicum]|uniref:Terminase small subunit n=1 Tax=Anaerotignum propionicum DSM 1682 TaxID=991789 RepID=A0A0X1U6Y1_ANAPI|nr:terminase small subunit [Anaerotignum propionicum]AMJ40688.1 terminase small subunit [Anaerotignum propionicum DSM 1682]SHE90104.1 phage terminase small subunit [[Clostridium] propionicum DSM 1682] [Anaerotignum propionicum DSM 1682]